MTTTDYQFRVLTAAQVDMIRSLQAIIGKGNEANGFHEDGQVIRDRAFDDRAAADISERAAREAELSAVNVRNYWVSRLALIAGEPNEAIEEVRSGRAVDETYYSDPVTGTHYTPGEGHQKPEGVPSEVADTVIRAFDFAYEADFDLAQIIDEKLAYNTTRGYKHGREF